MTSVGTIDATTIGKYAFENCAQLENLFFGESVRWIKTWAFSGCSGVKNIVFMEGAQEIGEFAFDTSVQAKVYFPISLFYMPAYIGLGYGCDYYCWADSYAQTWLDEQRYDYTLLDHASFDEIGIISMPASIEMTVGKTVMIQPTVFPANSSVITWKSSDEKVVSVIGGLATGAIIRANGEGTATITASIGGVSASMKVTVTKVYGLMMMPQGLVQIKAEAFRRTASGHVVIPYGTEKIGAYAFADCPKLETVVIPSSVTEIDETAFANSRMTIQCLEGSTAYDFAVEHGIDFELQ